MCTPGGRHHRRRECLGKVHHRDDRELARQFPVEADIVVPVPDSGNYAAPRSPEDEIIRTRVRPQSHIGAPFCSQPLIRISDVRVKLNCSQSGGGKRVAVIDELIVRHDRARSRKPRKPGAKEVPRVSCPPHRFAYRY
jgi:amidophosphoribosyltransferase